MELVKEYGDTLKYLLKWVFLSVLTGLLAGSSAAFFLTALNEVTFFREQHFWLVATLPLGGWLIVYLYRQWGKNAASGNNLLIAATRETAIKVPFRMAPLVLFSTLLTHLLGGSAGREGTAVQMGGAISARLGDWFSLSEKDKKRMIYAGISGGFAGVFGTPLAGAVFALEVAAIGKMRYTAIVPAFLSAYAATFACEGWGVSHTHYFIGSLPELHWKSLVWAIPVGIIFGVTARLFSFFAHFWQQLLTRHIKNPMLIPIVGGSILASLFLTLPLHAYMGLGIPEIVKSFYSPAQPYDFLLKLLLTTFTLGVGFKGGEVTPLFFIGATLGSFLSIWVPLPVGLLAGMGFTAVFAGATNTPIACMLMGMELFGMESIAWIAIACVVAYLFSGHKGIYTSQELAEQKTANQHLE